MKRKQFALCVKSAGCGDLVERKVYEVVSDAKSEAKSESEGFLRVVDESGEDYLYPAEQFVRIELPASARRVLAAA